jgi:hypothetical protein
VRFLTEYGDLPLLKVFDYSSLVDEFSNTYGNISISEFQKGYFISIFIYQRHNIFTHRDKRRSRMLWTRSM